MYLVLAVDGGARWWTRERGWSRKVTGVNAFERAERAAKEAIV